MGSNRSLDPIHIGLVSDEPLRLMGLASIFEQPASEGVAPLVPIPGTVENLLTQFHLKYLVLHLESITEGLRTLESIRRVRPSLMVIVIGPEGDDELVIRAISAGARGFLYLNVDTDKVFRAIEVIDSGSIYAPWRLLSKLVDRLLKIPDSSLTLNGPHLTTREKQVLDLILLARSNREISKTLGIEERTVKSHVGRLMRKTGADNRIELSMCALHRPHAQAGRLSEVRRPARLASVY
jgi:DNA-binding NarL/FixJ family response regulator